MLLAVLRACEITVADQRMELRKVLNSKESDVFSRKHNIFLGVSLGNTFFSKANLREYILWASRHTRNSVLVVIADDIQAYNHVVFRNLTFSDAAAVAKRHGTDVYNAIRKVSNGIKASKLTDKNIYIARWSELTASHEYRSSYESVKTEFDTNVEFRNKIICVVTDNLKERISGVSNKELYYLSEYVLSEIPLLLNGVNFGEETYDLQLYPSLSIFDELLINLQAGTCFKRLSDSLNIQNEIARAEIW